MKSRHFIWIVIIVNLVVFGQSITHQLVWDDHAFIVNQDHSRFPTVKSLVDGSFPVPDTGSYRPIRNAVYGLTIPVFKTNPAYHHAFILLLHILCSWLVYRLLKLLTGHPSAAQFGALLFAVHPIHTESIHWVTAGYDLIFVSLYLAAILAHLNYQSGKNTRAWLSYLLAFLAMLSNEIALTLPAMIMLIDYFSQPKSRQLLNRPATYGSYWLLAGLYWLIRMIYITENPFAATVYPTLAGNALLGAYLFGQYVLQLFLPTILNVDRLFFPGLTGLYSLNHSLTLPPPNLNLSNPSVAMPIGIAGIWLVMTIAGLIKKSVLALPLIWVPLSLAAVLRIVPLPAIYSERYAYVASIGFIILLVLWLKPLFDKPAAKPILIGLFGLYFAYFTLLSFGRSQDWQNDFVLWTKTLSQNQQSATAASSLGVQYFVMGDMAESLRYHRQAITLNPYVSSYQQNYVSILVKLGRYDDIIDFVNVILKTDAKNVNLYTILASTYDAKGEYDPAMANYQTAYDLSLQGSGQRAEIEKLVDDLDRKYKVVDETP